MRQHFVVFIVASIAVFASALTHAQTKPWNNAGLTGLPAGPSAPAPRRDLSGTWDARRAFQSALIEVWPDLQSRACRRPLRTRC